MHCMISRLNHGRYDAAAVARLAAIAEDDLALWAAAAAKGT
jgi:hypothetical protein